MIIPLSVSVYILLVHSATSLNLNKSKQVQKQYKEIGTPFSLNHPTSIESYVPVTVIYDDEEDINVQSKSASSVKINQEVSKQKVGYANHPPSVQEYDTVAVDTVKNDGGAETESTEISGNNATKPIGLDEISNVKNDNATQTVQKSKGRSMNFESSGTSNGNKSQPKPRRKLMRRRRLHGKVTQANKISVTVTEKSENIEQKETVTEATSIIITEAPKSNDRLRGNTKFQKRTQPRDPVVPIIDSANFVYAHNGDFNYRYESGDGTKAFESGSLKTINGGSSGTGVVGGFSYTDNDGNDFSLSYTADENGYRPVGDHLPTPPPIPPEILQALAILATKTTPVETITEKLRRFH